MTTERKGEKYGSTAQQKSQKKILDAEAPSYV